MFQLFDLFVYGALAVVLLPIAIFLLALARYFRLWANFKHTGRELGVRWWDAVVPFAVGVGIFAGAWLLGTVPAEGESGRLWFIVSGVFVFLGTVGLAMALGNLDEYRQLSGPLDSAGTVDAGPTALSGTAHPDGDTPTAPLSGEQALAHTLRVTEERGFMRTHPTTIHYEQSTDRFELDDGTGSVVVDPTDGAVRLGGDRVGSDSYLSTPVADDGTGARQRLDRLRERLDYDAADRHYEEMRLDPGTEVTVLGTVRQDPELRHPAVADGDRRLVLFEGDADSVRTRLSRRVKLGAAAGLIAIIGGAVGMELTAGVL